MMNILIVLRPFLYTWMTTFTSVSQVIIRSPIDWCSPDNNGTIILEDVYDMKIINYLFQYGSNSSIEYIDLFLAHPTVKCPWIMLMITIIHVHNMYYIHGLSMGYNILLCAMKWYTTVGRNGNFSFQLTRCLEILLAVHKIVITSTTLLSILAYSDYS